MAKRLSRTLSSKFTKQKESSFGDVKVDEAVGQRKIKAHITIRLHGVQNVPSTSPEDLASL